MLDLKPDQRLALGDEVLLQGIPELDHYYAFNVDTGDQYELNSTSHWVLETIGEGIKTADLCNRFATEFQIDPDQAAADLAEVITFALEANIIKEVLP